jgi:hypothetical protein
MAVAILVVEMVMVILVVAVVDWMIKEVNALVTMIALPIVIVIVAAIVRLGILMTTIGVVIEAGVIVVTAMTTVVLLHQIVTTGGAVAVKDLDPGPGIALMVMVEGEAGGLIVLGPNLLVGMVTGIHTQTLSVGIITILKVCLWAMLLFLFKEGI